VVRAQILSRVEVELLGRILRLGMKLDVLFGVHATVLRDAKVMSDAWLLSRRATSQHLTATVPILSRTKTLAESRVLSVEARLKTALESLAEEAALLKHQVDMNRSVAAEMRTMGHQSIFEAKMRLAEMQGQLVAAAAAMLRGTLPPAVAGQGAAVVVGGGVT